MESGENTNGKRSRKYSTVHSCAQCPFSTKYPQNYKQHLQTHSKDKPLKCPECPFTTKHKKSVKIHFIDVHQFKSHSSRPFPCPESGCSYRAKQKSNLTVHSKIHSLDKPFVCLQPNCNYSSNRKDNFVEHARIHTGEKPFICPFESCSYAAVTQSRLVRHSRTHTKEKPYKCPEPNCEYSTARSFCLKQHRLVHEPKEGEVCPSFSCPLCEYQGKSRDRLKIHAKGHTLEKFFKCDEPNSNCSFEARTKRDIENHKVVHSDEKPFACSFESCEFRCKQKSSLSTHLKTHSSKRQYKCELCPFRGKQRSVVRNHIKNIHSDPDFQPFKCTEPNCESTFKTKKALDNHILFHKGEKTHFCTFPGCGFQTVSEAHVKAHQKRSHETEKMFECKLFTFTTKFQGNLVPHLRTHTKEEPYICKEEECEYRAKLPGSLKQHNKRYHPLLTT